MLKYNKIHDISVSISIELPIYPGDTRIEISSLHSIEKGAKANILELKFGTHTGTHLDVPLHFLRDGETLDDIGLDRFCGKAKVFDLRGINEVDRKDIVKFTINTDDIVLFKTNNSELWSSSSFQKNFVYVTADAAQYLAQQRIKAVGIDYLSIEQFGSKDHLTHKTLLQNGIIILEGINLKNINPGEYYLCFFPLKLKGADGSPVRAVLFE